MSRKSTSRAKKSRSDDELHDTLTTEHEPVKLKIQKTSGAGVKMAAASKQLIVFV